MPHQRRIFGKRGWQGFPWSRRRREKTVGEMGRQLRRDHAGPQAIGLQPSTQGVVKHLLIGQIPEFVANDGIVFLVADEDQFQLDRSGSGTGTVGSHGRRRLRRDIRPQSTTAPTRGKQGETDEDGIPYRAIEHDPGDPQKGLARGGG
jgi:hypothetical protein